ncbi:hypothetical protein C5167_044379 [Papaver somniferum]|uniref:Uncharacterized protein n=1 Tax=Papaver somniferum TaxID=3469 RepID=A0A4Y7LBC1_PAPSO|nr:hypothetical protein C5167_044379 [Papaver somniferum]
MVRYCSEFDGLFLDYSWQCDKQDTMEKLLELAEVAHLKEKIGKMYSGEHINSTEDRSVLHVALRAPRDVVMSSDGINESLIDWSHGEGIERCCRCWNSSLGDWLQEGLIHSHCNSLSRRNPQDQPAWFRDCRVVDVVNMMPTPKGGTMELLYMQVLQSHPLRLKHFVPAYDLDMDFVLGVGGYDLDIDTLVVPSHMEYSKLGRMEMWQHTGSSMEILMSCANDMGLIPNVLIENFDDDRWYESNCKE